MSGSWVHFSFCYILDTVLPSLQHQALLPMLVLVTGLECAYIVHYYRLENAVQRRYHLANLIDEKNGDVGAAYEKKTIRKFG